MGSANFHTLSYTKARDRPKAFASSRRCSSSDWTGAGRLLLPGYGLDGMEERAAPGGLLAELGEEGLHFG